VLEDELGPLPETLEGRSARGARLFFTVADPPKEFQNRTGLGGESGVDVKVKGGQVVVAPSLHGSGVRYTWTRWPEKLAELPSAWVLRVAEPKKVEAPPIGFRSASKIEKSTRERAQAYLDTCDPSIQGQNGSARLMRAATCMVRGFELDERTALEMLMNGFNSRCQPPWSLKELQYKVAQAAELGDMEWGALKNAPKKEKANSQTSPYAAPSFEPPTDPNGVLIPIQLIFDNGTPAKIATNVARLLTEHPIWKGGPRRDMFSDRILWPLPLPDPLPKKRKTPNELCDEDELSIQGWLMSLPATLRVRAGVEIVHNGVLQAARWSAYDALQDRVEALPEWDRVERLDTWLTVYAGVTDTPVARVFARRWLIRGELVWIEDPAPIT
jgi:hypothetical protein